MKIKEVIAGTLAAMSITGAIIAPASAKVKVPHNPIAIVSSKEVDAMYEGKGLNKDTVYIERIVGILDNPKTGDGHHADNPKNYINYKSLRYKGKRLPKKAKIVTYCILNNRNYEAEFRIDFYKGHLLKMS